MSSNNRDHDYSSAGPSGRDDVVETVRDGLLAVVSVGSVLRNHLRIRREKNRG